MKLISDKNVRKSISFALKHAKSRGITARGIRMTDVDSVARILSWRRRSTLATVSQELERELSTSYLGVLTLGAWTIAMDQMKKADKPLPPSWTGAKSKPNPNFVLMALLTQVANHAMAVVALTEAGLDNPGRAALRTLQELCWLCLTVVSDSEKMIQYTQGKDERSARRAWYRHFGKRRLIAALANLEKRLGFDVESSEELFAERDNSYDYYSQATHFSFFATSIASLAWSSDGKRASSALFGAPSSPFKGLLEQMNCEVSRFLVMLVAIVTGIHGYEFDKKNRSWCLAMVLTGCHVKAVMDAEGRSSGKSSEE